MNDLDKLEVKLSASQETLMRMFQFMGSKFPDIPHDIIDPIMRQHEEIAMGMFKHYFHGDLNVFKNRFNSAGVGSYGTILNWLWKSVEPGEVFASNNMMTFKRSNRNEWPTDSIEVAIDRVTFKLNALLDIPASIALLYDHLTMHATNVGFRERLKLLNASVATLNKEFIEVAIRRNMFSEYTFKPTEDDTINCKLRVHGAGMVNVRIKTDTFGWHTNNFRIIETSDDGFESNLVHRFHVASVLWELMNDGKYELEFPEGCLEEDDVEQ
ncbi:MAG: hypothetical protein CL582_18650 [Alteromonadaceae bacterium]|nr:hypothetical protein [Alteromonadaceae bacterium]